MFFEKFEEKLFCPRCNGRLKFSGKGIICIDCSLNFKVGENLNGLFGDYSEKI